MKYNLHTHSFYCRHGKGTIQQYVTEAEEQNFELLGFSEHCPYPTRILENNNSRMYFPNRRYYEYDVREASKYSKIPVLLGYECDIWPNMDSYIKEVNDQVDFTIFGVHFLPFEVNGKTCTPFYPQKFGVKYLINYVQTYLHAMEMGFFLFGAHPDVFMQGLQGIWDSNTKAASIDIITAAKEKNIPLEVNGNGMLKSIQMGLKDYLYPNRNFWELASEYEINCVMNSDAHNVSGLNGLYDTLTAYTKELNLKMVQPHLEHNKVIFK